MDYDRLDDLLEKYWKLELSIDEEQELKELLQQKGLPEKHQKESRLFAYYSIEKKNDELDEAFDDHILAMIDQEEPIPVKKYHFNYIFKIAAALAILFMGWILLPIINDTQTNSALISVQDSFDDPEKAYYETKKALLMLSQQLNKGEEYVSELAMFNETTKKFEKN